MDKSFRNFINKNLLVFIILTLLVGCNFPTPTLQTPTSNEFTPISEAQQTLVTFRVIVAQPIPAGDSIYITVLDEVTGLAFNPHKYILHAEDALHYIVSIPFNIGAVVKYRYSREGTSTVNEHLYNARPVRYRLYHVEGPASVQDLISRWTDTEYLGPKGRIMGEVSDFTTGQPIPNLLVSAGGEQTFSLADGTFLLEGLPPGTHNLVFYSLDGSYRIYQQGAIVAGDSTTPVSVQLSPTKLVTVIFTITVPDGTPPNAPIRLAGNLYQMGNTFADLSGGVSALASRMPILGKLPDGRYMLTISLPAGTYIEYKYTLGDGLWSSEVTSRGTTQLRQLIIPNTNIKENDVVEAWQSANTTPIQFEVKVPPETPKNEIISIQFNPGFGWMEALPMWPDTNSQGQNVWKFDLTGPFNYLASVKYRYCRQNQCGSADDAATIGVNPSGREVNPSENPGKIMDEVLSWAWFSDPNKSVSVPDIQVLPRGTDFIAGISFQSNYNPSWGPLLANAIKDVQSLDVNWLILNPTWTFTDDTSPILEPLTSQDILWPELINTLKTAREQKLNTGIFPVPHFTSPVDLWWQNVPRDFPWWVSFFERYTNFILHHATVASSTGAGSLILGGDWLIPALPEGLLSDGSPSNVPQDAETRWRDLIKQVRGRYSGTVAWALSYPDGIKNPPPFLDAVDQIYILWSAALAGQPNASVDDMQAQAASILDQEILPFQQQFGKPIIIAISYPSIDGGSTGCIPSSGGGCLDYNLLNQPNPDVPELSLSLQEQANAYNAVLSAINARGWISGYVSMGYYPPALLQDKSISIHGKPASGIIWYWSQKFLGR
jgi:hypothetical protein